jgi:hypothetical protein
MVFYTLYRRRGEPIFNTPPTIVLIAISYHLGLLKAKLAKLRRELLAPTGGSGGGAGGAGFDVARTGIASVGFVG